MVDSLVFYRIKKKGNKYYLIKEWYDPETRKRHSISLGNCEQIEKLVLKIRSEGLTPGAGFEPARGYPHRLSRRELNQSSILANDFGFRSEGVSQVESISGTFKIDHGLLREFYGFITGQGISVETAKYYVNILKRFSKLPDPLSLSKSERTAMRKYVEFMFKK